MKFPLFIYIKPPDDVILQHIVPVVWWKSEHVFDKQQDEHNRKAYNESCDQLRRHVHQLEDIQVVYGNPHIDNIGNVDCYYW